MLPLTILIDRSNNINGNLDHITSVNQQAQVHFRGQAYSLLAKRPPPIRTQKAFFPRSGCSKYFLDPPRYSRQGLRRRLGWLASPSEVITRFLKVPVHRDKLRLSDSELWTSDSERWNGVYANAVCAGPGIAARLASPTSSARPGKVIDLWTRGALAAGRSRHSSALKLSQIPVATDVFVSRRVQEFR